MGEEVFVSQKALQKQGKEILICISKAGVGGK